MAPSTERGVVERERDDEEDRFSGPMRLSVGGEVVYDPDDPEAEGKGEKPEDRLRKTVAALRKRRAKD